jgi:hypothetical protein
MREPTLQGAWDLESMQRHLAILAWLLSLKTTMAAADCPTREAARRLYASIPCTPPDNIFADREGNVDDGATPKLFIGAKLAERYEIVKYIESGAFGAQTYLVITRRPPPPSLLSSSTMHPPLFFVECAAAGLSFVWGGCDTGSG